MKGSNEEMKKLLLGISLLAALLFTSVIPAPAYAASQTSKASAIPQARVPILWQKSNGGCGLQSVLITSLDGMGYIDCFVLKGWNWNDTDEGYLGLGDPGGPGVVAKAFSVHALPAAAPGWIRYYGGRYPGGTFCKFNIGPAVTFNPQVLITQIALNVPNSYHVCP